MHENMLAKLLAKKAKSGKVLSDNEKNAKMSVLRSLDDEMSQELGAKVKGLKKVTVASDSSEGLNKGLAKAKELISKYPEGHDESMEDSEEESMESPEEEVAEDDMSVEELDAKIKELEQLKKMKMMSE